MAVDLPRAKAHLRVDFDTDDDLITAQLAAAVSAVEKMSGRILAERALTYRLNEFPLNGSMQIVLPVDPVVSVESVDYVDADGADQSIVVTASPGDGGFRTVAGEPYMLLPERGASWPSSDDQPGAVVVRFTAGYGGDAGDAPAELDAAVLMMTAHLYQNREAVITGTISTEIPLGVQAMCFPFRRNLLG
jgi:uncharacterized phiE125 gp8 family phage protein